MSDVLPLHDLPLIPPGAGFDLLQGPRVIDLPASVARPCGAMVLGGLSDRFGRRKMPGPRSWCS